VCRCHRAQAIAIIALRRNPQPFVKPHERVSRFVQSLVVPTTATQTTAPK
jgi:hypothetical protein